MTLILAHVDPVSKYALMVADDANSVSGGVAVDKIFVIDERFLVGVMGSDLMTRALWVLWAWSKDTRKDHAGSVPELVQRIEFGLDRAYPPYYQNMANAVAASPTFAVTYSGNAPGVVVIDTDKWIAHQVDFGAVYPKRTTPFSGQSTLGSAFVGTKAFGAVAQQVNAKLPSSSTPSSFDAEILGWHLKHPKDIGKPGTIAEAQSGAVSLTYRAPDAFVFISQVLP